ncbi:hypothetical protein [Streptomyces odonnellii]|uniref:hypothetical protein n=1 Tax=Streptomyces odonnellii TaxID=1417980 RepID=UPI0006254220|nr:hypothetical protein [Streptomyces odonnellii]
MSRTTPPRPFDITALFPQLATLARTATRLHPRPGTPSPHDSSVGGPLLWPADEPWPHCDGPHEWDRVNAALSPEDVRLWRRNRAESASRRRRDPQGPWATPEELAIEKRIMVGRPWPEGPIAMLPVAQLYARDIPLRRPAGRSEADLLQVLWCPFDHPAHPRTALFWRSAATVTDVLDTPPEPPAIQFPTYLPEPCLLTPEQVTEYPNYLELSKELQEELGDWSRWQAAGSALDSSYEVAPKELYMDMLSISPGWKAGGWTRWGLTDPMPRICSACSTEAVPLLTIATTEWDDATESWAPEEDQANPTPLLPGTPPANFTMIDLARGYDLQLHVCPASPDHPHIELIQ